MSRQTDIGLSMYTCNVQTDIGLSMSAIAPLCLHGMGEWTGEASLLWTDDVTSFPSLKAFAGQTGV